MENAIKHGMISPDDPFAIDLEIFIREDTLHIRIGNDGTRISLEQMKKLLDPSEVGGTPFLGIQKPVIKAHGGSNARAIENAVLRAKEYAESGFIADIQANIEHMRVQPGMEKN